MLNSLMLLARITIGVLICCYGLGSQANDSREPRELAWFNNTSAQLAALTEQPADCVAPLDSSQFDFHLTYRLNLGRLAFNSPRLLGGQAGRMGLSCASCHPSGRRNTDFFIEQISDKPGRADISHHFLSSHGGDQRFNPKNIPDLADIDSLHFKNRADHNFDQLLIRLIETEFDGPRPTAEVFQGLKLYLAQNDTANCQLPSQISPRTLESDWRLIEDGLVVLGYSLNTSDSETTLFVSASMRAVLETFYRFYSINPTQLLDHKLIAISHSLESLSSNKIVNNQTIEQKSRRLTTLSTLLSDLKNGLRQHESHSFYNAKAALDYLNRLK